MKKIILTFAVLVGVFGVPVSAAALEGGYKEGIFLKSDDGNYSLKTNFFFQFQHQYLNVENNGTSNSFQIRRGRIIWSGNAFMPELTYKVEFEFVGGLTNNVAEGVAATGPNLLDGYVNYDFGNGIELKVGQYKVPFNFEELVPDTRQEFVDRSLTNDTFTFSRDIGLTVHGKILEKKLEYALFVMNEGNSRNTFNKNAMMLIGGRAAYNLLGDHGLMMADPGNSDEPQLTIGAATNFNRVGPPAAADMSVIAMTADAAYRYRGFSALGAGYYFRNQTASTNTFGFSEQVGYFVLPEHFEIAGRFNGVIPSATGVANGYEMSIALASYFRGHNLKVVSDYSILLNSPLAFDTDGAGPIVRVNNPANIVTTGGAPGFKQDQIDHRVRAQLQVYF